MTQKLSKAYSNKEFLNSHEARPIRVQCELIEPENRLRKEGIENTIVFFGSARSKPLQEAKEELTAYKEQHPNESKMTDDEMDELNKRKRVVKLSNYYEDAVNLSARLTEWSNQQESSNSKYYVCSGGGPGMMEAANKGAYQVNGKSVALGISLPFEQGVNQYATPELSFEFHYFFVRKFYFLYHAKAVIVFPGGFGTMDELFETLTLIQTKKLDKKMPIILYGKAFWEGLINFDQFIEWGVISPKDVNLFEIVDDIENAFTIITSNLE
ncbi:MAG: LOG family protein [Opitutae bacterium]|nr:LOG family protein [Opitutae bacterium]MBT5715860.1 LOG family protein [Opitutae bacterium]